MRASGWIGQQPDRAQLARWLISGSGSVLDARRALLRPLEPLSALGALGQQWGLFMVSSSIAFRIQVEVRSQDGPWQVIYRTHELDSFALDPWLSYRRVRGIYNPRRRLGPHPQYEGFVHWLGRKVLAEHTECRALRVRMERYQLGTPTSANQSLGYEYEVVHEREPEL